jgi:hypothetical protein
MTEKEYSDSLFAYLGQADTQRVWFTPVLNRLIKKYTDGTTATYEQAFRALKRSVNQMARQWKLEHKMSLGLSLAAKNRIHDAIARSIMEIYFARRTLQMNQLAAGTART